MPAKLFPLLSVSCLQQQFVSRHVGCWEWAVAENKHKMCGADYIVKSDLIHIRQEGSPKEIFPILIRPRWSPGHRNTAVPTACKKTSLPNLVEKHTDITPSTMSFRPGMWAESRQRQCLISSWKSFRGLLRLSPRVRVSLPYAHSQHNLFHTLEPKIIPQWLKTDLIDEKTELCLSGWQRENLEHLWFFFQKIWSKSLLLHRKLK